MRSPLILTTVVAASICAAPLTGLSFAAAPPLPPASYGATWTVNSAANALVEYADKASGAATPIATIKGVQTGLAHPTGIALDDAGNLYVANANSSSITEYAPGATGDASPVATIAGATTALDEPSSISYADGEVWVTDPVDNLVEAFSDGTSGDAEPAATISGSKTKLNHPTAVDAGSFGDLWVIGTTIGGTPSLSNFSIDEPGDVAPASRIFGSKTGLVTPSAVIDSDEFGDIWVADSSTDTVSEFFPFFGGHNIKPDEPLKGADTGLAAPSGLAIDAVGHLEVSNAGNQTVGFFDADAHGDTAPVRSITAVGTGAGTPAALAVFAAAPGNPTEVRAVAHDSSARVTWKAPANTGGGIQDYQVIPFPLTPDGSGFITIFGNGTRKTSMTVRHLTDGTKYAFEVDAMNTRGESEGGKFPTATPLGRARAPRGVAVVPGRGSIDVLWAKPRADGGRPIRHYRVEYAACSPGAKGCAYDTKSVGERVRHAVIHGLNAGKRYHARVLAATELGNGTPSRVVTATAK